MIKSLGISAGSRLMVFVLAWLSFGCLLGQFYGLWTMHLFGCWVLPPATALLAVAAYLHRGQPGGLESPWTWIVQGAAGGIVAAAAYDLYRLPFVLAGAPLFKVFPRFGELLLGATEPQWLVHGLGWAYHFSNGVHEKPAVCTVELKRFGVRRELGFHTRIGLPGAAQEEIGG